MQRTNEVFANIGSQEPVDPVKEKQTLYMSLLANRDQQITSAFYLNLCISALRCGLIDEKTYASYATMGIFDDIPFEVMAFNLCNKLLEDLEKEFAAGEKEALQASDQDENGIAECVRDAVEKAEA